MFCYRVLVLNGEEVEETEIPGFLSDQQTFYCANIGNSCVLQVTPISARLISCDTKQLISEWKVCALRKLWFISFVFGGQDLVYTLIPVFWLKVLESCIIPYTYFATHVASSAVGSQQTHIAM